MRNTLPEAVFDQTGRGEQAAEWFDAASRSRVELAAELENLAANPRMELVLDIPFMRSLMQAWPSKLSDKRNVFPYRRLLAVIGSARFARRIIECVNPSDISDPS
jgi:asparagine synthase (glutamine-hydrolysing)